MSKLTASTFQNIVPTDKLPPRELTEKIILRATGDCVDVIQSGHLPPLAGLWLNPRDDNRLGQQLWRLRRNGQIRPELIHRFDADRLKAYAEMTLLGGWFESVLMVLDNEWSLKEWIALRVDSAYKNLFVETPDAPVSIMDQSLSIRTQTAA